MHFIIRDLKLLTICNHLDFLVDFLRLFLGRAVALKGDQDNWLLLTPFLLLNNSRIYPYSYGLIRCKINFILQKFVLLPLEFPLKPYPLNNCSLVGGLDFIWRE